LPAGHNAHNILKLIQDFPTLHIIVHCRRSLLEYAQCHASQLCRVECAADVQGEGARANLVSDYDCPAFNRSGLKFYSSPYYG